MFDLFAVTMTILLAYIYYHGIIDHSGINFKAYWWQPWQPACIFHDNHHQYFHVNFGFNIEYWDKVRSDSHVYFMQTKSISFLFTYFSFFTEIYIYIFNFQNICRFLLSSRV